MTWQREFSVPTTGHGDMKEIGAEVDRLVSGSGIMTGTANVFVVGSTAAVGAIEMEPGNARDLPETLDRLIPPSRSYGHEQAWHDGNGHSHQQATWLGQSITVPVAGGKLLLGEWQQLFLLECDVRARKRAVVITVVGE
jgi:secondary thiamine-phosphate synthase enzyme